MGFLAKIKLDRLTESEPLRFLCRVNGAPLQHVRSAHIDVGVDQIPRATFELNSTVPEFDSLCDISLRFSEDAVKQAEGVVVKELENDAVYYEKVREVIEMALESQDVCGLPFVGNKDLSEIVLLELMHFVRQRTVHV